jgi:hypothetical protein
MGVSVTGEVPAMLDPFNGTVSGARRKTPALSKAKHHDHPAATLPRRMERDILKKSIAIFAGVRT